MVGSTASGLPFGIPVTVVEAAPSPLAANARSFTLYVVPLFKLFMLNGEVVPLGSEVHVDPLSTEYL